MEVSAGNWSWNTFTHFETTTCAAIWFYRPIHACEIWVWNHVIKVCLVTNHPNWCLIVSYERVVILWSWNSSQKLRRSRLTRARVRLSANRKFDPMKWFVHQSCVFITSFAFTGWIDSSGRLVKLHACVIRSFMEEPRRDEQQARIVHWRLQCLLRESDGCILLIWWGKSIFIKASPRVKACTIQFFC